jgi:hypothetical protein
MERIRRFLPFFAGISQYGGIGLGGIPSIQFEE